MRVWGQTSEWVSGLFSPKKTDTAPWGSRHSCFHWSDLSPALLELGNGEGAGAGSGYLDITCVQRPNWRLVGGHRGTGGGVWPGWVLLRLIAGCQELEVEGSKEGRGGGPWCLLPSRGPRGISFLTQQRLSNPYPPPLRDQKLWEAGGTSDNECPWSGCPGPSDGKWEDPFSLPLSLW